MLAYIKTGTTSPLLKPAERVVGEEMLRLISINIVNWLKLEHKRHNIWKRKWMKFKPMKLDENYPWCQCLKRLVQEDKTFGEYFSIEKGELYYHPLVDEETRNKARQLALLIVEPISTLIIGKLFFGFKGFFHSVAVVMDNKVVELSSWKYLLITRGMSMIRLVVICAMGILIRSISLWFCWR